MNEKITGKNSQFAFRKHLFHFCTMKIEEVRSTTKTARVVSSVHGPGAVVAPFFGLPNAPSTL